MTDAKSLCVSVSVVIPCYRCSNTIDRAMRSIAAQTRLPREVILIDDGSPDNGATLASLREMQLGFADMFSIQLIALDVNQGAATARNRGWQAATQPYVAFLDADDAWHPKKLEYQYSYMLRHPEVSLSGHGYSVGDHSAMRVPDNEAQLRVDLVKPAKLLLSNLFVTPSVMLNATISFRFREGQRYVDDHLLWLEIVLAGGVAAKLDAPLALIYKAMYGEGGLSINMWDMEKAELGNYWRLFRQHRIGVMTVVFLLPYSLAKYVRRLVVLYVRRRRASGRYSI